MALIPKPFVLSGAASGGSEMSCLYRKELLYSRCGVGESKSLGSWSSYPSFSVKKRLSALSPILQHGMLASPKSYFNHIYVILTIYRLTGNIFGSFCQAWTVQLWQSREGGMGEFIYSFTHSFHKVLCARNCVLSAGNMILGRRIWPLPSWNLQSSGGNKALIKLLLVK